jgi:hypothetical protein
LVDNKGYLLNVIHGKSSLPADYYLVLTLELIKGESGKGGEDWVSLENQPRFSNAKIKSTYILVPYANLSNFVGL